ncbi:MAG: thioredoxin family protein [Verrucomicrobia bacterium]|nr:thioredoxin family protein [Verrucomicrobiota bacterium]MBS0638023.1 thioredoxin family protein [Verrucomicrobiota bacterium]
MKFYTILCALTGFFAGTTLQAASERHELQSQQEAVINWTTDFQAAKAAAKQQNKPMFVFFTGSDWCPWCVKMDSQILSTPEFQQALAQKLIFVKIDFPRSSPQDDATREQNKKLKHQFDIQGFPTIILLDPNGARIEKMGFQAGGGAKYAQKVIDALDAYSKKSAS